MIIVQLYTISPLSLFVKPCKNHRQRTKPDVHSAYRKREKERDYILYIVSFLFIYNIYIIYI